ncbi:unnamed protein product [Meloidogyne enterolobii]|uniref:Uncharacterized protein n=1 Tax=Meloidogyne enterolobii TaxID=390850 RepID=A0ACB1A0F7_MELEN
MNITILLIISILNAILWTFVKTIPTQKDLAKHAENDNMPTAILNDVAESSINPQIQKSTEEKDADINNGKDKVNKISEYNKEYYQKNKQKLRENTRNRYENNKKDLLKYKEIQEYHRNYRQNNKESIQKRKRIYYQNNKEKLKEYQQKYQQKNKNLKSANNEGTSFVNPQTDDFTNKEFLNKELSTNFTFVFIFLNMRKYLIVYSDFVICSVCI